MGHYDSCYESDRIESDRRHQKVVVKRRNFLESIGFNKQQSKYLVELEEQASVIYRMRGNKCN